MDLKRKVKVQTYIKISKNIDIEKIKRKYPNIPEDDLNMCISMNMYEACEKINSSLMKDAHGDCSMRDVGENSLDILKKDFLDLSHYFLRHQSEYNYDFNLKREQYTNENPFYVSMKCFDDQFKNLEEDSDLDIYAKTLYWSNKVVKEVEVVKENVTDKIVGNENKWKMLKRFENNCKLGFVDNNNLRDEYISIYKEYLEGKISKEQLLSQKSYTEMEKKLRRERKHGLEMSHEEVFKYLSLGKCINTLYLLKDSCIESVVSSYSKLQEQDRENKELAIYYKNEQPIGTDLTKKTNSVILSILVKGTNSPIMVHCSPAFLDDMENCYSTLIPEGECKLDQRNTFYVKYSDKQKEKIEEMNKMTYKENLDNDVREYIERRYNMCNDLDGINVKDDTIEFKDR